MSRHIIIIYFIFLARVHGYTEASKLFQEEEDEKAAIFGQFLGLVGKFVSDSHAAAQEKGLEATLYFVQNSSVAGKTVKDVMSAMIAKSIAAPKKSTQELSLQIALMYIEIEKQEAVVEELVKGLEHKNPKIVAACLTTLTTSLREFGSQVVGIKPLIKPMLGLLEDRDKTVRDETKALVVEIYRWIGEAIKPQLSKLKAIQLTELEAEFEKVRGEKAVPTRYLRSQQAKQAKATAGASEECAEEGVASPGEVEIDPLSLIDPINVLAKIPNDFYEKIEAKKWQERKEAVDNLDKILDYPKFEKGEFGDLIRALMKVVSKDSNVVVVGVATKCVARLALGLKKGFHPYANATLPQLLAKFKEKKANVVTPLREAVDAIYPSTSLEAIQEDVIASLDNKNPSIKAETAAFLGRCFAQCTPTILNKKLLKPLATALLKTLNEPDPSVRDCSADALGVAMKVVGEKVLLPFLPDIDALKLSKIKESCEKAVVKTVAVKAAAPKTQPPPVKTEAPKKVLSGGAIKAQAPKVQKPVVVEKEMSSEEVDVKAAEYIEEDILKNLADAAWKTRLDGIEAFQNILMAMDPSDVAAEVMTKILAKKPGLKDNNFQVMKLKLDCLKFIAETFPMSKLVVESVVSDVTEKLGDPKNGTLAGETLMALAEVTNLDIVGFAVLEFAFSQKSVKVQQEALDWTGEAIQNFGLIIQSQTVIDSLKKGLNSTNSGVRQSAAALAGIVHLYLGQQLLQRLDEKPAAVALVTAEIEKHAGEDTLEPSRTCKIPREPEQAYVTKPQKVLPQQPQRQEYVEDEEDEEKQEEKKPAARVDISPKITEQLLADLADKNWKVRNEALLSIQTMVTDTKIKSNLGELPPLIVQRFVDSNSKLVVLALEVCTALASAMGPGSKNHVRTFARGMFNALGDNKQWVRSAAMTCLNAWAAEAGAKEFFSGEVIPDVLKTGSASLRTEVWTWLGELLPTVKGLPKDELCLLIPHLFTALEDRNAEVRKAGNNAVLGMMTHVGYYNMTKEVEKLKPASKAGILQILDKIRPDVPEIETKTSKLKPEVKGKAPPPKSASTPKARASIAPTPTKAMARKKDEDVDTSPLLLVNKMKNQRVLDEQKLKTLKWNFTTPRAEFVELLRDQVTNAGFNKNLIGNMFHADFKFHIKAIESLSDDLCNEEALIANLDLILKWMTLRFFDTNPSVLLKGLEYVQSAFSILIDREYTMFDVEANSFIPYLVMKIGDPKDAVRDRVHAILRQFSLMHAPGKLFLLILDGLKSKNSRLRTECLDELGYLIEQFGTSVCLPSSAVALKEISKQISDRDNSVRSAALNAIVKAYFVDGEKIYKQIGKLSDKDMSYLEERIKRASQNRMKMMQDVTRVAPEQKKRAPEPEIAEEYDEPMDQAEVEPEPAPVYVPEPLPQAIPNPYKRMEIPTTRLPKVDLIEIDDSFLDSPVYIPESIRVKMQKPPPANPLVEEVIRNVASENIQVAIEGGKKLHAVMQSEVGDKLEPYSKTILDALLTQLTMANSYSFATHGSVLGQLYKIIFRTIEAIFGKKTPFGMSADENHLKSLIRELLIALVDEKTTEFQEGGFNQWIVVYVSQIIENSDTTQMTCATVNALYDLVGHPPTNPKLTDLTTKCLLKIVVLIRRSNDLDSLLNLDKVLYTCHLFMQAYPRYTWKDRPSDVPLKAVKTLLMNLVTKKGPEILIHMRSIENPISSELSGYLKKMIKQTPNASKSSAKLTKSMSDHLSEVFKTIANEGNGNVGMLQLYEFKKQHPDVDLSAILAPTTQFFQEYVAEGLRQIEKERGPLKKAPEMAASSKVDLPQTPVPAPDPPSDPKLLPQYYRNKLWMYQKRLGMPLSNLDLPEIQSFDGNSNK